MRNTKEITVGSTSNTQRAWRSASIAAATALAATTLAAMPAAADERHRVSPGETVSALAVRYDSSVSAIVNANSLNSRALIVVGQTLTIPTSSKSTATQSGTASASGTYRVKAGDTVWGLARAHGTTVSAIIKANGLNANATIRIGQTLTIPGAGGASPVSQPVATSTAPTAKTTGSHKVVAGDTVWNLARSYGTSVSAITKANGLNANATIRIGQTLSVPGATAVGSTPAASSPSLATGSNSDKFDGVTQTYTVAAGDTLGRIAQKFGVSVQTISAANAIKNPSLIRIGQKLTIPGGTPTDLVGDTFLGRTYSAPVVGAANQNKATLNAMDVPTRAQMQAMIVATAKNMGVDPALAQAIAYQESGFNMRAVSPANAVGAMQVIPSTGAWMSDVIGRQLNLLNPQDNVTAGVALLRHLQRDNRSLETAIAGYYQGETGVRKYGMHADTKRYVANVLALMNRFS